MEQELIHSHFEKDMNSDSIVGSCNCLTKTPDIFYHKKGCKYRLIVERDKAISCVAKFDDILEEIKDDLSLLSEHGILDSRPGGASCATTDLNGAKERLKKFLDTAK